MDMARVTELLSWQWRGYWRRILRGGTAAKSNLLILGLIALAGFSRYITLLRDVAKQVQTGNTFTLKIIVAVLFLICFLPIWDSASLPLKADNLLRFPLSRLQRFALRILSRFVTPTAWVNIAAFVAVLWPIYRLPHGIVASVACVLLLSAGFFAGATLNPSAWFTRKGPSQRTSLAKVTLLTRELRLQLRLFEVRTALLIALALCVYLATADHPEPDALRVILGVLGFITMAVPMNVFGLDGVSGFDRLLLLPIRSASVLREKNKSFMLALGIPMFPLAAFAAWRFGWLEGTANLLEGIGILFVAMAWGNIASVRHPGTEANVNIVDQVVAMIAIAIPPAVAIGVLRGPAPKAGLSYLALAVAATVVCYAGSIRWSARYVNAHYERIRQTLLG